MHSPHAFGLSNSCSQDESGRLGAIARLLYALLDAADDDGLMRDWEHVDEWRSARHEAEQSCFRSVLPLLAKLMSELAEEGRLDRNWILRRWNDAKTKLSEA